MTEGKKLSPQQPDSVSVPKPSRRGGSFMTKQGHHSLPQQRPVLQPRGLVLTSDLTFLSLHTAATLSKKPEQHSTSTYHVSITRLTALPRMFRHTLHFLQPKQKLRKSPLTCSKQRFTASPPSPASPTTYRRFSPDHLAANHLQLLQHSPWDN